MKIETIAVAPITASEVPCAWCWLSRKWPVKNGIITIPPPTPKKPPAIPVTSPAVRAKRWSRRVIASRRPWTEASPASRLEPHAPGHGTTRRAHGGFGEGDPSSRVRVIKWSLRLGGCEALADRPLHQPHHIGKPRGVGGRPKHHGDHVAALGPYPRGETIARLVDEAGLPAQDLEPVVAEQAVGVDDPM